MHRISFWHTLSCEKPFLLKIMITRISQVLLILAICVGSTLAQDSKIQSGPMVGYVEMQEALIWVQTTQPADVRVEYWVENDQSTKYRSSIIRTAETEYLIAKTILVDLNPATTYRYDIYVDNERISLGYPTTVTTQALWQWRTDPPDFTFAIGSCMYVNEPEFDRPGNAYGGEHFILERIADKKPDFMIWMGDNTYLREADFYSAARMNHRYRHTRQLPELQRLLASTAHYSTWDDHDFGPNNADRNYSMKDEALRLFNSYWGNPRAGHDGVKGVYFRFQWADIDFFVTDGRYHRAPNALKDSDKSYLGPEQMQWLKDGLANSTAPFKIVVFGNQAINTHTTFEAFSAYPAEFNELFGFIETQAVPGIVFVSGDRHHAELLRYETANQYPLYEFTSSPLTAGASRQLLPDEQRNPMRLPGMQTNARNFGLIKVTGKGDDRKLTFQNMDVNGELLWEHSVTKAELNVRRRRE